MINKFTLNDEIKLRNEYESLSPDLSSFSHFIDTLFLDFIKEYYSTKDFLKIYYPPHLKSANSFISKVLYRKGTYNIPLHEITDKVRTRFVLLDIVQVNIFMNLFTDFFKNDLDIKIVRPITKEPVDRFQIVETTEAEIEKVKKGEYDAPHFIVRPRKIAWPCGNQDINNYSFEVQLHTLFIHAISELNQHSGYKGLFYNDLDLNKKMAGVFKFVEQLDEDIREIYDMIGDTKKWDNLLFNEIVHIYKSFKPDFPITEIDKELTSEIFDLLKLLPKSQLDLITPSELQAFQTREHDNIMTLINNSSFYLANQPVSLLVAYLIEYHQDFIRSEWPLDLYVLKATFNRLGKSFGEY